MSASAASDTRPRVLFVYYTHTQQAKRVCDAMTEVMRGRGCDVTQASIEFTDPRYLEKFATFPFKHAVFDIVPLLWPQLRRKTGQIKIPDEAKSGDYDLICLGSPTWFFTTNMPLRSYLKSDEAGKIPQGNALRRLCGLPQVLERQSERSQEARHGTGRRVRGRDAFHVQGRSDPVAPVAAQLLRQG